MSDPANVLIIGSGPVGMTFARVLLKAGLHVVMIDAGGHLSGGRAPHMKNADIFQRNIDLFSGVIISHLIPASVSTSHGTIQFGQNPHQNKTDNLAGAAVAYAVGGMGTHWTCATPRAQGKVQAKERIPLVANDPGGTKSETELGRLYAEAEKLVHTDTAVFKHSLRQGVIEELFKTVDPYKGVTPLPLAAMRVTDVDQRPTPPRVRWTGPEVILNGGMWTDKGKDTRLTEDEEKRFSLIPEHLCTKLTVDSTKGTITDVEITDVRTGKATEEPKLKGQKFDRYVVACGSIMTAQLLWNSGIKPNGTVKLPVGKHLCEQTMAFCQIVLSEALVEKVEAAWKKQNEDDYNRHLKKHPDDPTRIPFDDPEPNLWIPVSANRPWHCQIHRDAFHYGAVPPDVDSRRIVDLRWFSTCDSRPTNEVTFSDDGRVTDLFGMPQPTFHFQLSAEDHVRADDMMRDMENAAAKLGGFLAGSEPRQLDAGFALHITGTTRIGADETEATPAASRKSVVNSDSKVWGVDNLYLGGGCVIPTGIAGNTTLTSVALAIRAAEAIGNGKYHLSKHLENPTNPEFQKSST